MAEPIFLISGATGATGGATAEQLLEKNRHVRVLTHRQDERSERLKRMGTEVVLAGPILFGKIDKRTFLNHKQLQLLEELAPRGWHKSIPHTRDINQLLAPIADNNNRI